MAQHPIDEATARGWAVRDLGDALASARGFERVYLTNSELKILVDDRDRAARSGPWLPLTFFAIAAFITASFIFLPPRDLANLTTALMQVVFGTYWLVRWWTATHLSLFRYARAQIIVNTVFFALMAGQAAVLAAKWILENWLPYLPMIVCGYTILVVLLLWSHVRSELALQRKRDLLKSDQE